MPLAMEPCLESARAPKPFAIALISSILMSSLLSASCSSSSAATVYFSLKADA